MKVFIDGLIFGRQQWGGISRMWEEYLLRLPDYLQELTLLAPFRHTNRSLSKILERGKLIHVKKDFCYWPARYFERIAVRSKLLNALYVDDTFDIFHSTYLSTVFKKNIKKVVTVYDMIPELFQRHSSKGHWVEKEIAKKEETLKNADCIIVISQNTGKDLLEFYPWIPEDKIRVNYLGFFDKHAEAGSLEELMERFSLHLEKGNYYLYVGNRKGYKNFRLLEALVERPEYRDAVFLCVGGEKMAGAVKSPFVFLEYADDEALAVLYRNAAALIVPSKYEGFGLPVLEAMANECPVVCSGVSSLPEVGGDAAFYFDPDSVDSLDDALRRLSKADRPTVIEKGKENTKRFSWERSTENLMDIYKSLLQ
jgi:glycosyltransferase involved in cell wall biosynthesis